LEDFTCENAGTMEMVCKSATDKTGIANESILIFRIDFSMLLIFAFSV
jgi:hypothetical protein